MEKFFEWLGSFIVGIVVTIAMLAVFGIAIGIVAAIAIWIIMLAIG